MINYVYIAVGAAFLGLVGVVKYQSSQINELEAAQAVWTSKNEELAARISDQNTRLKDGEDKYLKVQSELDVAKGKNQVLAKEYKDMRDNWRSQPVPQTCPDSLAELKTRSNEIAKKWNTK
jgi:hypothetical protein